MGAAWEGTPLESASFGTPLVESIPATAKWLWMALLLGGPRDSGGGEGHVRAQRPARARGHCPGGLRRHDGAFGNSQE